MRTRIAVALVLLAAAVPGLLFAPVFGLAALLPAVAVVVVTSFAVAELCARVPVLAPWRPVLALVVGLLGLVEVLLRGTTRFGLPTGATVRALVDGALRSWQLTLQSTWPARPDADLLLFVPLAVLVAGLVGVELLGGGRRPLPALTPGLLVLLLSQAYGALTGVAAIGAALAYAFVVAGLLVVTGPRPAQGSSNPRAVAVALVPVVLVGVVGALVGVAVDPAGRQARSVRQDQVAPLPPTRVASPLNEVADRLLHPTEEVFSYTTSDPVDRWRLVVLDTFDGVSWTAGGAYRRMGARLEPPPSVPAERRTARVDLVDVGGSWLPSQALPASVEGIAPLVQESSGALRAQTDPGRAGYGLSWWEPSITAERLGESAIDQDAEGGLAGVGTIPAEFGVLADTAVGGMRATFRTALVLEEYLRDNYLVALGADMPTGSGLPQLRTFLLDDKRGTSEQFAAAYVVLARSLGIPARLAVGYRAPKPSSDGSPVVVRGGDVLAWPEVAVAGVGWVPLDPSGRAAGSANAPGGLAEKAAQARERLPQPQDRRDPELADSGSAGVGASPAGSFSVPWTAIGVASAVLLVAWLAGVPLLTAIRAWRRRRRPGARAVVGAWWEARDRLRAHGVALGPGMTVRDAIAAAGPVADPSVVEGLHALAAGVDVALWSGKGPGERGAAEAWAAVRTVRRGLARRPPVARLRAAVDPRALWWREV